MIVIEDDSITSSGIYRGNEIYYECLICGDGVEYHYDEIDDHTELAHGLIPYSFDEWVQKQRVLK